MANVFESNADRREAAERADSFLRLIERSRRGRLKVYLGYGPGVGKTYRMLQEARSLKEQGIDVVVGYVEDHGRPETQALVEGLEVVPRRREDYRGVPLEEMHLDAVLERQPTVAIVDELAHTNAPGSRHGKRYEDVLTLLDEGIHVITTLNVQHLESLYDTVERLVGVKVKERLPDWVLAEADEVVNIDLSTDDLEERMRAGKIYPLERIQTSLANFFQRQNLEHLRNLTLREIASHIEGRSRTQPGGAPVQVPDQVLVCLSSRGPDSPALLRYGSRLAGRMNRTWYALYVQTPAEEVTRVDAETQRLISNTLALAHELGATVFTFKGEDVAETILRFANEYGVGQIVIGRPGPKTFWQRLTCRPSLVERLIKKAEGKVIVVLDTRGQREIARPQTTGTERPQEVPRPEARRAVSEFLGPGQIVIWYEPVTRDEVVETLLQRALTRAPGVGIEAAREQLAAREAQGTTFLDEGIALPHARIAGLADPAFALGLPHGDVTDAPTSEPIEMIWLFLMPEKAPAGFMPTAVLSRMFRDPRLREALRDADGPAAALRAILQWEAAHPAQA